VKHYLELITDEQAAAIKQLKVGDPIDCGGRREVVTKTEPPSLWTKAPDGEEAHYFWSGNDFGRTTRS